MKKIQLILCIVIVTFTAFGQTVGSRQFKVKEALSLFGKTQAEVFKILALKGYSYKSKQIYSGSYIYAFYKQKTKNEASSFELQIRFKNNKVISFSPVEMGDLKDEVVKDLLDNSFVLNETAMVGMKVIDNANIDNILNTPGTDYQFENTKLNIGCAIMFPLNGNKNKVELLYQKHH